jgi:cell division protein FtsW (lipid II flippase)
VAVVARVPSRTVVRLAPLAYFVTVAMLVLVLAIGISPEGLQARRWLPSGR